MEKKRIEILSKKGDSLMKQDKSELIQNGDMYKVLLTLSVPIMINSIIQTLYNLVDGIWDR